MLADHLQAGARNSTHKHNEVFFLGTGAVESIFHRERELTEHPFIKRLNPVTDLYIHTAGVANNKIR
jgi:hypothetical protein